MRFDIGGDVLDLPIIATITIPQSSVFDILCVFWRGTIIDSHSWTHNLTEIQFLHQSVAGVLVLLVGAETMALQASVDPCNPGFVRNPCLLALSPLPSLLPLYGIVIISFSPDPLPCSGHLPACCLQVRGNTTL